MSILDGIKGMFSGGESDAIEWNSVEDSSEIDNIIDQSNDKAQLLYKHSSRCSICWFAKSELEQSADDIKANAAMHFVDVIKSRDVSNYIAEKLGVRHESPQALLIQDGKVIWHESHSSIKGQNVLSAL